MIPGTDKQALSSIGIRHSTKERLRQLWEYANRDRDKQDQIRTMDQLLNELIDYINENESKGNAKA